MRGNSAEHGHQHDHSHGATTPGVVREERQPPQDEAVEVSPGVIRVQLPISIPGLGHVNCYAMPDKEGITLVDPGLPGPKSWRELTKRLKAADLPVKRVHTVVITHSHPDHFGQAGRLHQDYGARVVTHRNFRTYFDRDEEIDEITTDDIGAASTKAVVNPINDNETNTTNKSNDPWPRQLPWGSSQGHQDSPDYVPAKERLRYRLLRFVGGRMGAVPRPTHRIDDEQSIELGGRRWVGVFTPGHTNDHLCLLDPETGTFISGDHVLPTITPHISGLGSVVDPLSDFFRSLEAVGELEGVNKVLPAHGLEFANLAERAQAVIDHHQERLELLREASGEFGWATVSQYSTKLFKPRSWGRLADSETYAHLEHLRITGRAEVRDTGTELQYLVSE